MRDSSTQGHKGNHNGQVDGFSFELLAFKHEKQKICFGFINIMPDFTLGLSATEIKTKSKTREKQDKTRFGCVASQPATQPHYKR